MRQPTQQPRILDNGVGVDLSVGAVSKISATPGCRYSSVDSAEEFEQSVAKEFLHDAFPIAFDIKLELLSAPQLTFEKGYGSAEVNESLKLGASSLAAPSLASPVDMYISFNWTQQNFSETSR